MYQLYGKTRQQKSLVAGPGDVLRGQNNNQHFLDDFNFWTIFICGQF